jgi:hypothetical protein
LLEINSSIGITLLVVEMNVPTLPIIISSSPLG